MDLFICLIIAILSYLIAFFFCAKRPARRQLHISLGIGSLAALTLILFIVILFGPGVEINTPVGAVVSGIIVYSLSGSIAIAGVACISSVTWRIGLSSISSSHILYRWGARIGTLLGICLGPIIHYYLILPVAESIPCSDYPCRWWESQLYSTIDLDTDFLSGMLPSILLSVMFASIGSVVGFHLPHRFGERKQT